MSKILHIPSTRYIAAAVMLMICSSVAPGQELHNPGFDRPRHGFTPTVLRPGSMITELGLPEWSRTAGETLQNTDFLVRIGTGFGTELQLGTNRSLHSFRALGKADDPNTSVAIKYAIGLGERVEWGVMGRTSFACCRQLDDSKHQEFDVGTVLNWEYASERALKFILETTTGHSPERLAAVSSDFGLPHGFGAFVEVAARDVADEGTAGSAGYGLTWLLRRRIQLDVSSEHRLTGPEENWRGGVGLSVYFGS